MTITEGQAPASPVAPAETWARRDRIAGWTLILAWLCLFVMIVVVGDRPTAYTRLTDDVSNGNISEVELMGGGLLAQGGAGYSQVEVRWHDGLITRTATLTEATDKKFRQEASQNTDGQPVVVGSVEAQLTALNPDLRVVHLDQRWQASEAFGWRVPDWLGLIYLALIVGTLMRISASTPWRATRWAWAWLVLLTPALGVPAYLLLGGPVGLLAPRPTARLWLTGGWAFVLALLLGGGSASR